MQGPSNRWIYLILLLIAGFTLREVSREPLAAVDRVFASWLAVQRDATTGDALPVVLVEIDDSSMSLKPDWPWAPLDYALFLKAVLPFKPSVVAIEPVLAWKEARPEYLETLVEYVIKSPRLLLAVDLAGQPDPEAPMPKLPILTGLAGDRSALLEMPGVLALPQGDLLHAAQLAPSNLASPDDCPDLRPAVAIRFAGHVIPTFPLRIASMHLQLEAGDLPGEPGTEIRVGEEGKHPLDREGRILIDPRKASTIIRFGYDDLLLAIEKREAGLEASVPLEKLENAIVILGRTDTPSRTCIGMGNVMVSKAETIAAATATLTATDTLVPAPLWLGLVFLALGIMVWPVIARLSRGTVLLVLAATGAAYAMIAMGVASFAGVALPASITLIMLLALGLLRLLQPCADER